MSPARSPAEARCGCGERGSGTVLVLTVVLLAGLVLILLTALGQAVAARHRAQAAADLAALAAASQHQAEVGGVGGVGGVGACDLAQRIARANGARLTACAATTDVTVGTGVDLNGWLAAVVGSAPGRARAGPAEEPASCGSSC